MKQIIIIRTDLKLPKGKLAVQVAHASVTNVLSMLETRKTIIEEWVDEGQKKVVVKVPGIRELIQLKRKAKALGLEVNMISDAGLTVVKPGTKTCLAIGPDKDDIIDDITKDLKLL